MSLPMEPYTSRDVNLDRRLIEQIILDLGFQEIIRLLTDLVAKLIKPCYIADTFDIRVLWDHEAVLLAGVFALAGGLVGGYTGGRLGAAVGAGIGGAAGLGVSAAVSLREIWDSVKDKLKELTYIVINYLRRFDVRDYERAYYILMACASSRRELVRTILEFIGQKLSRAVFSNIQNS